jgi:hypothetical protein
MSRSLPIHTLSYPHTVQNHLRNHLRNLDQQAIYLRQVQKSRELVYLTATNRKISLTWNPSPLSLLFRYRQILRERNFLA